MYEKLSHSLKSREQINLLVAGTQSSGSTWIAVNSAALLHGLTLGRVWKYSGLESCIRSDSLWINEQITIQGIFDIH